MLQLAALRTCLLKIKMKNSSYVSFWKVLPALIRIWTRSIIRSAGEIIHEIIESVRLIVRWISHQMVLIVRAVRDWLARIARFVWSLYYGLETAILIVVFLQESTGMQR